MILDTLTYSIVAITVIFASVVIYLASKKRLNGSK